MSSDFKDLVESLSIEQLRHIVLEAVKENSEIRASVLSTNQMKDKKFNELSLEEWNWRLKEAISSDLFEMEMDDYYPEGFVDWQQARKVVKSAVFDLIERKMFKESFDFIEVSANLLEENTTDAMYDENGCEIHIEYSYEFEDEFAELKKKLASLEPSLLNRIQKINK